MFAGTLEYLLAGNGHFQLTVGSEPLNEGVRICVCERNQNETAYIYI
jgi:hypothetical protein